MNYDRDFTIGRIKDLKGKRKSADYISNIALANAVGYSDKSVKKWLKEDGNTDIPIDALVKMAELFKCDLEYLINPKMIAKTKEQTDICNATGLSKEAVEVLTDNNIGNRNCIDAKEYKVKIINHLLDDFKNENGLMANIFICLRDKDKIEDCKSNKWYPKIIEIIDGMGINLDREDVLNAPYMDFTDEMQTMASYIDEVLIKEGYTEEEVETIKSETDGYFFDYRAREITKEMIKAALQIKITRYIDNHLF